MDSQKYRILSSMLLISLLIPSDYGKIIAESSVPNKSDKLLNVEKAIEKAERLTDPEAKKNSWQSILSEVQTLRKSKTLRDSEGLWLLKVEIRTYLELDQFDASVNAIKKALNSIGSMGQSHETVIRAMMPYVAELRRKGKVKEANACEEQILSILGSKAISEKTRFRILTRLYFAGNYHIVLMSDAVEKEGETSAFGGFSFARLRARAAQASYWRFYKTGWPNEEQIVEYRRLAKLCRDNYEAAFLLASDFEKVQLSAEWWKLNANCYYTADSTLLRKPIEFAKPTPEQAKKIEEQTKVFEAAVLKSLTEGTDGQQLEPALRENFAKGFALEFKKMAAIGIPDEVFNDLLKDLPLFFDRSIPFTASTFSMLLGESIDNQAVMDTMGWYLWGAIVKPHPDEIEQEVIREQVDDFVRRIETKVDSSFMHPRMKLQGSEYAKRLKDSYGFLKDNRFIPYFKRAMLPHEYRRAIQNLDRYWHDQFQGFKRSLNRLDNKPLKFRTDKAYAELQKQEEAFFFSFILGAFTWYDRPLWLHLPDKVIWGDAASMNKHSIYVFIVSDTLPISKYPAMKELRSGKPEKTGK